jgi:hypothetical protein
MPVKIETIMYLLPLVFMLHDFEEIVMMKSWMANNAAELQRRFPRLSKKLLGHFSSLSTSAFALAVAEEFVLISAFCVAAVEFQWFAWWAGLLLAFFFHLLVHMGQFLVYRKYVPTVVTSLPAGLYCILALQAVLARTGLSWNQILLPFGVMTGIMLVNLWAVHRLAAWFETQYEELFRKIL